MTWKGLRPEDLQITVNDNCQFVSYCLTCSRALVSSNRVCCNNQRLKFDRVLGCLPVLWGETIKIGRCRPCKVPHVLAVVRGCEAHESHPDRLAQASSGTEWRRPLCPFFPSGRLASLSDRSCEGKGRPRPTGNLGSLPPRTPSQVIFLSDNLGRQARSALCCGSLRSMSALCCCCTGILDPSSMS